MKLSLFLPVIALALICPPAIAQYPSSEPTTTTSTDANAQTKAMNPMHRDAIEIIQQDHDQIRKMIALLEQNLQSDLTKARSLFPEFKDFLIKHETMEQTVWYPELEKNDALKKIIAPLKKEEEQAGKALGKLADMKDDAKWAAELKKFMKAVEQHAKEEETKLFPKVRKQLNKASLEELGDKLNNYKGQNATR